MNLQQRMEQLRKRQKDVAKKLEESSKNATLRAIEKAVEETPPKQGDMRGANTRTGEMKEHWVTDSQVRPKKQGNAYVTTLANQKEYASFVNDGHRMDRHFVPGLYIDPSSGMLSFSPGADVGIVVGTQTFYVPGLFMVDKAKNVYQETIRSQLKEVEDLLK